MKKFILALAAMVLTAGLISAQDMAQATELAKNGNDALGAQNYTEALNYFQQALDMATQLEGDEAAALVEQCKGIIPNIALEIAKDLIKDKKYEEAASKINEVKKIAEEYEVFDVYDTADKFLPQIWKMKANDAFGIKDYAAAVESFEKAYAIDTTDAKTAITIGQLYSQLGNNEKALEALQHAAWNGQEAQAKKLMSNVFLKEAQAALKGNKLAECINAAKKVNEIAENANAYKLMASASQKLGKTSQAIESYEKYLELNPSAQDANGIYFTIAALYQGQKNKAKAIEFYKKVANDAKYGASAKQQITALSK